MSVLKPPEGRQRSSRGLQLGTLVLPGRALGTAGHHRSVVQLGFLSCRGAGMHIGIFLALFKVDAHQEAETDQEPQAQRQERNRMSVRGFDEGRVQQRRREARQIPDGGEQARELGFLVGRDDLHEVREVKRVPKPEPNAYHYRSNNCESEVFAKSIVRLFLRRDRRRKVDDEDDEPQDRRNLYDLGANSIGAALGIHDRCGDGRDEDDENQDEDFRGA